VHQTGIFGRFFRILWVKMGSSRVKKEYCGWNSRPPGASLKLRVKINCSWAIAQNRVWTAATSHLSTSLQSVAWWNLGTWAGTAPHLNHLSNADQTCQWEGGGDGSTHQCRRPRVRCWGARGPHPLLVCP
jgi:hypothetical protein